MTVDPQRPWPARTVVQRLGLSVLVLAVLAAVAVAATAEGRKTPTEVQRGPSLAEVKTYIDRPERPVTYDEALKAGTVDDYDWGDRCDTERRYNDTDTTLARVAFPSSYAPPCVPAWGGDEPWVSQGGETFTDNGGATAPGVTATTIKVVFYLPAEQDIAKQLEQFGIADSAPESLSGVRDLVEMSNHLYETYGRKVEVIPFRATGDGRSPTTAMADAVRVVEMGAFASIGGPTQTAAYQHELARNGVICLQCGYASTDDVLATDAPYAWGYLATPDQLLTGLLGFGAKLLGTGKAKFAGDAETRATNRKMGVVHYEQDPPVFGPLKERSLKAARAQGADVDTIIQYILDPNSLNAQAQAIIGRLKREGVTTVVFLGDPLMPRLLTQQADKQDYHPEWIFTGTVFTDTTAVARLYDRSQMAHAFGTSSAAARTEPEVSEAWKLYEWWFGREPSATKTMTFWGPVVQMLFLGIHLAGPDLDAETFAGGLFDYPPTGGTDTAGKDGLTLYTEGYLDGDTTPSISFGFHQRDDVADYVAVDDFTSVWWNGEVEGPDENGDVGPGMWEYTGLGLRIDLVDPTVPEGVTEDFLFQTLLRDTGGELAELVQQPGIPPELRDLAIATPLLTATPKQNELPDYPSYPESPKARADAGG